jgi:hypothetical protein
MIRKLFISFLHFDDIAALNHVSAFFVVAKATIRHAGENRHPGSFSPTSKIAWIPASAGMTNEQTPSLCTPKPRSGLASFKPIQFTFG